MYIEILRGVCGERFLFGFHNIGKSGEADGDYFVKRLLTSGTLIFLLALPQTIVAKSLERSCKGNPKLVAECFSVRGRMQWTNGTPNLRIWRVGTKRYLGVLGTKGIAGDAEHPTLPANVRLDWNQEAYADFEVCPFTKDTPGEMQMVCVESAKNVAIRKNR